MQQLFLHAGTVKTGTTYLQKTLHDNRAVLQRHGLTYPEVSTEDLALPRYVNARFLYDPARTSCARQTLEAISTPYALISEEGMFGNVEHLLHPVFQGLSKKVIVYIRPTAELIAAWAAEFCQPYNVLSLDHETYHPAGRRLLTVPETIEIVSHEYAISTARFMNIVDEIGRENLIVRPFERASFVGQDLLTDFLHCLGIDADAIRGDPDFRDPGPTNVSQSRKYCDVSHAVWHQLGQPHTLDVYNYGLVETVVRGCVSGDERPVVETLTDAQIDWITYRFQHFESFISKTFLAGRPLFQNRYPSCFGLTRAEWRPVDNQEVEALTAEALGRRRPKIVVAN